jgi:glycosyltransferase involved in cell wall biosynthesis
VTEFLEHEKNGLLVDFFDVKGLANRVCEALAEPRRFDELRENARKLIAERYDRDSICVPALLKMFEG